MDKEKKSKRAGISWLGIVLYMILGGLAAILNMRLIFKYMHLPVWARMLLFFLLLLLVSLLTGLAIGIVANLIPALHMDKIMIGDIMLMIPGLAMTNALRNMLVGNTISGTMRLAESLIWAASLAGGFMVALAVVEKSF